MPLRSSLYFLPLWFASAVLYGQQTQTDAQPARATTLYAAAEGMAGVGNQGRPAFGGALSGGLRHTLTASGKLTLGYGVRITALFSPDARLTTSPSRFTRGAESLAGFFKPRIDANIDTVSLTGFQDYSANVYFSIGYAFGSKWRVEGSLDAIGISAYRAKDAAASQGDFDTPSTPAALSGTALNVLLIGDSDRGQLNSALAIAYRIRKHSWLRLGFHHVFSEVSTPFRQVLPDGRSNNHFRLVSNQVSLGVEFKL